MKMLFVLGVAILATGCARSDRPADVGPGDGIPVTDGMGSLTVKEVTLSDGTRCAVAVGYQKGAITCDWKKLD